MVSTAKHTPVLSLSPQLPPWTRLASSLVTQLDQPPPGSPTSVLTCFKTSPPAARAVQTQITSSPPKTTPKAWNNVQKLRTTSPSACFSPQPPASPRPALLSRWPDLILFPHRLPSPFSPPRLCSSCAPCLPISCGLLSDTSENMTPSQRLPGPSIVTLHPQGLSHSLIWSCFISLTPEFSSLSGISTV